MSRPYWRKRGVFALFLILLVCLGTLSVRADFYGKAPTGLIELDEYKYPVYLYVPQNYKPNRDYPMIITVPGEGESPEKNIKFWIGAAKRRSMLVLAPTNIWPEELPYTVDSWLLKIKKDITTRFRVSDKRIFLIGKEGGAHYASYLGTNYPDQFSAVALLGDAWVGRYSKILKISSSPHKQRPFYIALKDEGETFTAIESKAKEFTEKGYPVFLEKIGPDQDFSEDDFKKRLLAWLDENAENWQGVMESRSKSWKQKIFSWIDEFLRV